ncbi:hypothetical protein HYALB_00000417 [Hymenoscyphus albidus]|uniref:Uncharacterized protein n=1 Tax=Hymenoscyphus albidus TaxID=595503 RepID=A0A9N9Q4G3_9HELO|nr:hypothetical protein HYALB_00000417 [Hymenoscyphus albidus]
MFTSQIDPRGLFTFPEADLPIVVKHGCERVIGKVSSTAMCLASPVWKKFIKPPFGHLGPARTEVAEIESFKAAALGGQESDTIGESQLDFQDDNSEALPLLLRIAHFQFVTVTSTLTYHMLLSIAVLVDQYDCVELVHPWIRIWVANENVESLKPDQESWLFIAWVFGSEEVFQTLATSLVRSTDLQNKPKLMNSTMPPSIIESIFEVLKQEISKILEVPYNLAEKLQSMFMRRKLTTQESGHHYSTPETECHENEQDCDDLFYGSLMLNLTWAHLWPKKRADEIHISAKALAEELTELRISHLTADGWSHESCPPKTHIKYGISNILATNPPTPVLDSHILHIKTQHKRLNPSYEVPLLDKNPSSIITQA